MRKQKDAHRDVNRQKDLATIKGLFSVFSRPLVDRLLDQALADRIHTDHIDCLGGAEEIVRSTLFHLYDQQLRQLLKDFFHHWDAAWDVSRATHHDHLHRGLATLTLCDTDPSARWVEHGVYLDHVMKAQRAMAGLTKHLHEVFPDFDLAESDREASRKYWELVERVKKQAEELWGDPKPEANQPSRATVGSRSMSEDVTHEYLLKVERIKELLVLRSTNKPLDEDEYASIRRELVAIPETRSTLPEFVRRCGTVREFWHFIKDMFDTDKHRRRTEYLQQEFLPILSWLEGGDAEAGAVRQSKAERTTSMIKVLLLSANPIDSPLSIDEEFRAIDQKIRSSEHRDDVDLIKHGAVRLADLPGLLLRHKPHVVHFSGHGAATGIALTGNDGAGRLVPPNALAEIFRVLKDNVRVVLLNACDSAPQAEALVSVIDCAVGMGDEIEDGAAIAFAAAFYETLGYGRSVQDAFNLALVQLAGEGADRSLPKLHKRRGVKPSDIVLVTPQRPQ